MHSNGDYELGQMRRMLKGRYEGKELKEVAERLGRYYSVEQVRWMLDDHNGKSAILVFDQDQERLGRVADILKDVAEVIPIHDRNRIDFTGEANLARVRLVLAAGKGPYANPSLNTQEIRALRLLFPGYVVVYVEDKPTVPEAFRYGKTDCDDISLVNELPDDAKKWLNQQDKMAERLETDWVGLICKCLHAGDRSKLSAFYAMFR